MIRIGIAAGLLLILSTGLAAQQATPPPPPPPPPPAVQVVPPADTEADTLSHLSGPASFTISGVVVSATTGTPLDRAEVTLTPAGQLGSPVAASVTIENGTFRFDHLQAGNYSLQASRRGYVAAGYQEHEGYYTGVVAGAHLDTSGLRFELFPTAVIDGTVTDDSGEPVAGAQVRLYREDQSSGQERVLNAGADTTDDLGMYEFAHLRAGTYYISVAGSPWYAFHPRPKTDENGNLLPPDQQPRSPLDVAYPTTYYENGVDSDSAMPMPLHAGDHAEADLSLHAVPAVHIQVRLPPPVEGRGMSMPQLMQHVFGSDQFQPANQFMAGTKGGGMIADFSGVAPGHYELRQFGPPGEETRARAVDLTVDSTVDFTAATASGVDVSGKVGMATGEKLPSRSRLWLVPADGGATRLGDALADDGTFTVHSVAPGRYDLQVVTPGARLAIVQMMATGAEVQGSRVTVGTEPVMMAATLARGTSTIEGYAKQNGNGVGGAMILLVPRDPNASDDLYRRDQSNTDGSFTLARVVPGEYTVVAIENGWTLDWAQREAMAPYLARGVRVRVTGEHNIELPGAVEVQAR